MQIYIFSGKKQRHKQIKSNCIQTDDLWSTGKYAYMYTFNIN